MNKKVPKVILFLLACLPLRSGEKRCDRDLSSMPKSFALRGYVGLYKQNITGCPRELDKKALLTDFMKQITETEPFPEDVITLSLIEVEPFTFAFTTETSEDGVDTFYAWGPLYSILRVASENLNCSLKITNYAGRSVLNASFKYRAETSAAPLFAHFRMAHASIDENDPGTKIMNMFGIRPTITRTIGVEQVDCIAFRKEYYKSGLLEFIAFIDKAVGWLFATSLVLTAFALSCFKISSFWRYLLIVVESLFGIAQSFKSRFYCMFVLLTTIYWLFQQFFGADIFSNMTKPAVPKIIDSWDDLTKHPHLKIVAMIEYGEANEAEEESKELSSTTLKLINLILYKKEDYFSRFSPHYKDFTGRLKLLSINELRARERFTLPDGDVLDRNTYEGNVVVMSVCRSLRYRRYNVHCGAQRDQMYVSKSGGEVMPYFMFLVIFNDIDRKLVAVNEVIVCLTESGIYQKWLTANTYDLKEDSLKKPIFEYKDGELKNFKGPLWIFLMMSMIAFAAFCLEILLAKLSLFAVTLVLLYKIKTQGISLASPTLNTLTTSKPRNVWM